MKCPHCPNKDTFSIGVLSTAHIVGLTPPRSIATDEYDHAVMVCCMKCKSVLTTNAIVDKETCKKSLFNLFEEVARVASAEETRIRQRQIEESTLIISKSGGNA
jgi:hypothetical protein